MIMSLVLHEFAEIDLFNMKKFKYILNSFHLIFQINACTCMQSTISVPDHRNIRITFIFKNVVDLLKK